MVVPGCGDAPLTPFQETLLRWAAGAGRHHLPWRQTRDPWAVLVSEVMLQQTQVARVVPVYGPFLRRFPTPAACAAAPPAEVVRAWAGLGYNRRAVNLHRAATAIVERHDGRLPADVRELQALPGIGAYTARAVLAFAYEADVGVVETNSARVLARAVAGTSLTRAQAQVTADVLVPHGRGWEWNSAMLDLGATVCTTRAPRCGTCPLAASACCAWSRAGHAGPDPAAGTAGTGNRQSTFAGSDRQGRGRLVAALRLGPVSLVDAGEAAGWHGPGSRSRTSRVVAGLVADGLVVERDGWLSLP